jgi:hypothetical protein
VAGRVVGGAEGWASVDAPLTKENNNARVMRAVFISISPG